MEHLSEARKAATLNGLSRLHERARSDGDDAAVREAVSLIVSSSLFLETIWGASRAQQLLIAAAEAVRGGPPTN